MSSGRHAAPSVRLPLQPARMLWLLRRYDHHGPQLRETATVHRSHHAALVFLASHIHQQGWRAVHTTAESTESAASYREIIAAYFDNGDSHVHPSLSAGTHHDGHGRPLAWYTLTPLPVADRADDEFILRGATLRVLDDNGDDPHHPPVTYHLDTPLGIAITLQPIPGSGVAIFLHPADGPGVPRLPLTVWVDTDTGTRKHDYHLP